MDNPVAAILINIMDFDTGLTRYDLYDLSEKALYWNRRINEIENMPPGYQKQIQRQELVAQMLKDPAMRKIVNKLLPFGFNAVEYFFRALVS